MAAKKHSQTAARTRRRAKPKPELKEQWSILVFGLAILAAAFTFVPGSAGWSWARMNLVFGVFGVSGYLLAPALVYLAVLIATGSPVKKQALKVFLGLALLSGVFLVFSPMSMAGHTFETGMVALFEAGKAAWYGPGAIGALFGWSLLALCGRPGANILQVVLLIVCAMAATGVTPADLYYYCSDRAGRAKQRSAELRAQRAELRAQRELEAQQERAAQSGADEPPFDTRGVRAALEDRRRAPIDIDLGAPAAPGTGALQEAEKPVIGPGGTFGLNAAAHVMPPRSASITGEMDDVPAPSAVRAAAQAAAQSAAQAAPAQSGAAVQSAAAAQSAAPAQSAPAPAAMPAEAPGPSLESLVKKAAGKAQTPADEGEQLVMPGAQPDADESYMYPPLSLFQKQKAPDEKGIEEELTHNADLLVKTLDSFGVKTRLLDISRGPSVTRYELQPLAGVKISRITGLSDDIALNLATAGVRIEAPIPGKAAVGIEIPNKLRNVVNIRSILESAEFSTSKAPLTFALGKDIAGKSQIGNLAKMPHLLIAGTTGSGKSVCTNSIIISFLYRCSPEMLRLILIDPKMVEFAQYNGIPHLLMPVVTEPRKAAGALGSAVAEMEKRYRLLAENGVPNIEEYNDLAALDTSLAKMPYIVIVIDELADLMMVAGKEVEDYICRLAQKARAAGMHLIVATQRPSVDVITGLIKANIPSRIGLSVMSQVDSRTILDTGGAEKLLGNGDMLYMPVGVNKPVRVQGTFVRSAEIRGVIDFIKRHASADYDDEMIAAMDKCAAATEKASSSAEEEDDSHDAMLPSAVEVVIDAGQASTSLLQRRCKLGYARAARIMDEMEQMHIIGPYEGAKPRQVLISRQQWIEMSMQQQKDADPSAL